MTSEEKTEVPQSWLSAKHEATVHFVHTQAALFKLSRRDSECLSPLLSFTILHNFFEINKILGPFNTYTYGMDACWQIMAPYYCLC